MDPVKFWHDNLGRHLYPNPKQGEDPVKIALSQNYLHATKASALRLGAGKAASLVQDGRSILMADVRLPYAFYPGLTLKPGTWRTIPNWMSEIIEDPPEPPFMFVIYGKNPNIQDRLRVNATQDVVEICGVQQLRCRPSVVRQALDDIGDMSPAVWRKAAFLYDWWKRDPMKKDRLDEEIDKLTAKHPMLEDLLYKLPPFGSGDYEAVTLVHSVRGKMNAARSADEALEDAA